MAISDDLCTHNVIIAAGLLWYVVSLVSSSTDTTFTKSDNSDSAESNTQQSDTHIPRLNGSKPRATSSYVIFFTLAALSVLSILLIVANLFPSLISIRSVDRLTFFASSDTTEGTHEKAISANTVKIGALLPLTGVSSSSGKSTEAALDGALNDVNAYFSDTNSSIRYDLVVHDTESDPTTSLEKAKASSKG